MIKRDNSVISQSRALRRLWRYQSNNQNPYIEDEQTLIYTALHRKLKIEQIELH